MEKPALLVKERSQDLYLDYQSFEGGDGQLFYLNSQAIKCILQLYDEISDEYTERNEFISFRLINNHFELLDDFETEGMEENTPQYLEQPRQGWKLKKMVMSLAVIFLIVLILVVMARGAQFLDNGF